MSILYYESSNEAQVGANDLRQLVKDTSMHPFNGIGRIKSSYYDSVSKTSITKYGTACIVNLNLILTSAHVLYFDLNKAVADQVQFFPEQFLKGQKVQEKGIKITKFFFKYAYIEKKTQNQSVYDFVFLKLEQNDIIQKNQILPLNFDYQFSKKNCHIFNISGYSGNVKGIQHNQFFQQGPAQIQQKGFLLYKHTTYEGNSGGPVLLKTSEGKYEVIGVHKGSYVSNNYCILLKTIREVSTGQLLNQDYYSSCLNFEKNWDQSYLRSFRKPGDNSLKDAQTIQELQTASKKSWENTEILGKTIKSQQKNIQELEQEISMIKKTLGLKNEQIQNLIKNISEQKLITETNKNHDKNAYTQLFDLICSIKQQIQTVSMLDADSKSSLILNLINQNQVFLEIYHKQLKQKQLKQKWQKYLLKSIFYNDMQQLQKYYNTNQNLKQFIHDINHFKKYEGVELQQSKFYLLLDSKTINIVKMEELMTNFNSNHLQYLYFSGCKIDDGGFEVLMKNCDKFKELKVLMLNHNNIRQVACKDLQKLPSIEYLSLHFNPLSQNSKNQLRQFKKKHSTVKLRFYDQ